MKDKTEIDKIFDERNIYVLLFNSRHVIHIPSFRIVSLLCCECHFSNITFTDDKTKYGSPYVFWGRPQDVILLSG